MDILKRGRERKINKENKHAFAKNKDIIGQTAPQIKP